MLTHLMATTNEVGTEHVDVVLNPTHIGVEEVADHPGRRFKCHSYIPVKLSAYAMLIPIVAACRNVCKGVVVGGGYDLESSLKDPETQLN